MPQIVQSKFQPLLLLLLCKRFVHCVAAGKNGSVACQVCQVTRHFDFLQHQDPEFTILLLSRASSSS